MLYNSIYMKCPVSELESNPSHCCAPTPVWTKGQMGRETNRTRDQLVGDSSDPCKRQRGLSLKGNLGLYRPPNATSGDHDWGFCWHGPNHWEGTVLSALALDFQTPGLVSALEGHLVLENLAPGSTPSLSTLAKRQALMWLSSLPL